MPKENASTVEVTVRPGHTLQTSEITGQVPGPIVNGKQEMVNVTEARRHGPGTKVKVGRHEVKRLVAIGVIHDPDKPLPIVSEEKAPAAEGTLTVEQPGAPGAVTQPGE